MLNKTKLFLTFHYEKSKYLIMMMTNVWLKVYWKYTEIYFLMKILTILAFPSQK